MFNKQAHVNFISFEESERKNKKKIIESNLPKRVKER